MEKKKKKGRKKRLYLDTQAGDFACVKGLYHHILAFHSTLIHYSLPIKCLPRTLPGGIQSRLLRLKPFRPRRPFKNPKF